MQSGYVRVWEPMHPLAMKDGYVLEHRKVLHDAGVEIPDGHEVHHRNGVKHDNRLENLEVLANGAHQRHHMQTAGVVVNQFGEWPVGDVEGQRRRKQEYMRRWREKNAVRAKGLPA